MATVKHVLFYKPDPKGFGNAQALFPAHVQHAHAFHAAGKLLSFGAFADLMGQGSMGVFSSKEAAEEFVKNDPFVSGGVVASHTLQEWNDILA